MKMKAFYYLEKELVPSVLLETVFNKINIVNKR